jgi:LysR family transcriptional regulator, transcriptional activator of the cysJI operon
MLNLQHLSTFVTVISEGSMTSAADKLYLTQPAVSQQIRNLEDDLGVEVLVRGVRQVKPTLQGELLYDYAKKVLQLVSQAEVAVRAVGAELRGELRVGTLNSIGLHLMSPIVAKLLKHNPDLHIKIEYNKADELLKSFKKGTLDILILPESKTEFGIELEDVEKKFVFREEMWLVGSGKDGDIPRQITLQDLPHWPLVLFSGEYPSFNSKLSGLLTSNNIRVNPVFESANVGTLKRVIETGLGWGFLPSHAIKKQVRSGRMNRILVSDFSYEVDHNFYFRKNSEQKKLFDIFFQALTHQDRS